MSLATNVRVICPLEFEKRVLLRAGVGAVADIVCSGPGPDAMARCVESLAADGRSVVLVGVAGGLSKRVRAGQCCVVTEVRSDADDNVWQPTIDTKIAAGAGDSVVCGVDAPVTTVAAKRELFERTGADLVDMESHAFVRVCRARGLQWGIVRGVSDGPDDALPVALAGCVREDGKQLTGRAMLCAIRNPMLMPAMVRLRKHAVRSLQQAAEIVRHYASTV